MKIAELPTAGDDHHTEEFLRLMGQCEWSLHTYVIALVPNWADAEEIIQKVRIRLWQQFDQYDPAKNFGAWARTIAHYMVLAFREKTSRQRLIFSQHTIEDITMEVSESFEKREGRHAALMQCLDKLDADKQSVLMRYYRGNETLQQVSKLLGRSYEALRQELRRTRLILAKCIEQTLAKEE